MPSQVVLRLRILVGCVPQVAWFSRTRRVRLHEAREIDEWQLIPDYPVVIGRSFGIGTGLLVQGLLAVFTLPTVLQAEITNVVVLKEAEVEYRIRENYHSGNMDIGTFRDSSGDAFFTLSQSGVDDNNQPWSSTGEATLKAEANATQTTDSLVVTGSISSALSLAHVNIDPDDIDDQVWKSSDVGSTTPDHFRGGNLVEVRFSTDLYLNYEFNLNIETNNGARVDVYLLRMNYDVVSPEIPTPIAAGQGTFRQEFAGNLTITNQLHTGDFRLLVFIAAEHVEDAKVNFTFEASTDPTDPLIAPPPPGGYPLYGSKYTSREINPDGLVPADVQILSETNQGDGTTILVATANLRNNSTKTWDQISVDIEETVDGQPAITQLLGGVNYDPIAPTEQKAPLDGETFELLVADGDLATVRASLLAGERFRIDAALVPRFTHQPEIVDPLDIVHYVDTDGIERPVVNSKLLLAKTEYARGTLLVLEEPYLIQVPDLVPVLLIDGFRGVFPFLVAESFYNRATAQYEIRGETVNIADYLIEGSFEAVIPPASAFYVGGEDTDATPPTTDQGAPHDTPAAPFPRPVVFNRVKFGDLIEASGSIYLRPEEFGIDFSVDEQSLDPELIVHGKLNLDVDLLLEVLDGVDNSGEPIAEKESTIVSFPLFAITLPNGFTMVPKFSLNLAATVNASAGFAVPFNTEVQVAFRGGTRGGEPVYECEAEVVPQSLTDLTIYQQMTADVTAEAEFQVDFEFYPANLPALSTGPTMSAAAVMNLGIDTAQTPVWNFDTDLEIRAGMNLEIDPILDIVDAEKTLFTIPVFSKQSPQAGAAVAAAPQSAGSLQFTNSAGFNPGLRPIFGENHRWMRSIRPFESTSTPLGMFVTPLTGSTDYIVGDGQTFSRITADGALLWTKYAVFHSPIAGVAEPDGGFTLLTDSVHRIQLSRYDANGDLVWIQSHDSPDDIGHLTLDLLRADAGDGLSEYIVLIRSSYPNLGDQAPAIAKFDDAGEPLAYWVYTPNPHEPSFTPQAFAADSDGDIVIIGTTSMDTGADAFVDASRNLFALKINSTTGAVIWSKIYGSVRSPRLETVAIGPDDTIYIGGNILLVVTDEFAAPLLARIKPDGTWDAGAVFTASNPELSSPYDSINSLLWHDGNLWAAGHLGLFSGISQNASAFTARLTERLGVTRFSLHAGPGGEEIEAIAPAHQNGGVIAVASAASFIPWPTGATDHLGTKSRLILNLPYENLARYHRLSAGSNDDPRAEEQTVGTHFIEPLIVPITGATDYFRGETDPAFTANILTLEDDTLTAIPADIETFEYLAIEDAPASAITNTTDYFKWSQLDPEGNEDGDDLTNREELFWGTDLLEPGSTPGLLSIHLVEFDNADHIELRYNRNKAASDLMPNAEYADVLNLWNPLIGYDIYTTPIDLTTETLHLRFPFPEDADGAPKPQQFYRVIPPVADSDTFSD